VGEKFGREIRADRVLLDQIGGRWMPLILGALCDQNGSARFNELKRAASGISQKTLTQCLRQLERSGLVKRTVISRPSLRIEYSFTKLGYTLEAPVIALYEWTAKHSAAVRVAQERYDKQV